MRFGCHDCLYLENCHECQPSLSFLRGVSKIILICHNPPRWSVWKSYHGLTGVMWISAHWSSTSQVYQLRFSRQMSFLICIPDIWHEIQICKEYFRSLSLIKLAEFCVLYCSNSNLCIYQKSGKSYGGKVHLVWWRSGEWYFTFLSS